MSAALPMDAALANRLAASVRAADPDRYFATLFAPARERAFLFALYAFHDEVARVAETVREPMLGAIRLEWWRETAEAASKGSARNHDVARGLAALFAEKNLALGDFEALIAARGFDSSAERLADFTALESYVDSTSGALMRLAAKLLGGPAGRESLLREAGLAYGLSGLLRSLPFHNGRHKLYLPLDLLSALHLTPEEFFHLEAGDQRRKAAIRQVALKARDHFLAARQAPRPGAALAAVLPAALVPVYLRRLEMGREVPIHRRQMALLSAAMKRRL
ncbi:MAG TPA: squalene/phytoene synthase family protein [Rhizomicrobium sp.]|nr:squalene/phytoene synthase family protein [Rhizomicrobium sp.]